VIPAKIVEDRVGEICHHGAIGVRSDELHEFLWVFYRQRPEQHDIHEAEEGGIGSDAQSQRKDRHRTERRRSRQRADCIAQVLPKRLEGGERP